MAEFKKLVNLSFDGNAKAAYKPALGFIDAPKKDILKAVKQVMMMGATEKWIRENPSGTAAEFKRLPPHIFNEVKDNNTMADAFLDSNRSEDPSLDELIASGKLNYQFGLEDYQFTSYKEHIANLDAALKTSDDETRKTLTKAKDVARLIERK